MLREIHIQNYKSILDQKINLGRVNVFIGENGSGKTNVLEALGMASITFNKIEFTNEELINNGIRVAMPSLTKSAFKGKTEKKIKFNLSFETSISRVISREIVIDNIGNENFPEWKSSFKEIFDKVENSKEDLMDYVYQTFYLSKYTIYNLYTNSLRGLNKQSNKVPLGIYGEGLDLLLSKLDRNEIKQIKEFSHLTPWLKDFIIDINDNIKNDGYKQNRSNTKLYFSDKFLKTNNNIFSAENTNEGVLHILFYLVLFISKYTPKIFAIDNIDSTLNPHLCRTIIEILNKLAITNSKQALITTHNPDLLDGLDLTDDEQRLFIVRRNDSGHSIIERVMFKDENFTKKHKLSEMWMNGDLGAISNRY